MIKFKNQRIILQTTMTFFVYLLMLFQLSCQSSGKGAKVNLGNREDSLDVMLEYYTVQDIMTDPGEYAYLYKDLPSDVSELCQVIQGVVIHIFWANSYGVELSEERKKEVQMRKVEDMLKRIIELDDRPITFERDPNKCVVGNCRDYSVFFCSVLRHRGIPARARCGFGTYFTPGLYMDHWICEYWNTSEKRWVQFDAQIDSLQEEALQMDFDPHNLPSGNFLTGGEVWKLCRAGKIDPDLCGIFDLKGLWFVAGNVMRDFMALNKLEILPWDCNVIMEAHGTQLGQEDYVILDKLAELTTVGNRAFSEVRAMYENNNALRMPADWKP